MGTGGGASDRWAARPVLGALVHGTLTFGPVLLGIAAGVLVRSLLPAGGLAGIPRWVLGGIVGTAVVWGAQVAARRLTPLSWLLRLGLLFPGEAPSRFRVARQAGRTRDLAAALDAADAAAGGAGRRSGQDPVQYHAEVVLSLISALASHDKRTRGHAERTRVFTDMLADQIGLPRADRDRLRWAALLHDIGKLEVSARILNKPGRPTAAEWEALRRHPEAGDRLIEPLRAWLGEWADTVVQHHERWDGGGYPAGLAGERICLGARIVAVADAYDVMTAARSYKRPSSARAAREELVACAGTQFDPAVVRAFLLLPLPRVRWAFGPLAWVGQLPGAREVVHLGAAVPAAAGTAAAALPAAAGAAGVAAGVALVPASGTVAEPVEPVGTDLVADVEESGVPAFSSGTDGGLPSLIVRPRDRSDAAAVSVTTKDGATGPDATDDDAPGTTDARDGSGMVPDEDGGPPGRSGDAPGRRGDAPGRGGDAPGRSGDAPGNSGGAPGRSGDAPGRGGDAPGHGGEGGSTTGPPEGAGPGSPGAGPPGGGAPGGGPPGGGPPGGGAPGDAARRTG